MVGWISPGGAVDSQHGEALDVREACNKIIHAKKVEPQYATADGGMKAIGATISLFVDRRGEQWSAERYLQPFCIAVANVDFYPHHTGWRS